MDMWDILSYAAWGISALLLLYIVFDAITVSLKFDEEFLLSSREGTDDLIDQKANDKGNGDG